MFVPLFLIHLDSLLYNNNPMQEKSEEGIDGNAVDEFVAPLALTIQSQQPLPSLLLFPLQTDFLKELQIDGVKLQEGHQTVGFCKE